MKKIIFTLIILIGLVSCQSKVVSKKTIKCQEDVKVGSVIEVDGESYKVVDEIMLKEMISNNDDITYVCTSKITSMSGMFRDSSFNQDISSWDVSNVTDMSGMFSRAPNFNQPIGNWDVSNVASMDYMFSKATSFNQPIGNWDVSNVASMDGMFSEATSFNQPIGNWDVSNVVLMDGMFSEATSFNQPIGNWDVSSVKGYLTARGFYNGGMDYMFENATSFKQDIGDWDVSSVSSMSDMFLGATAFNKDGFVYKTVSNWVNKPTSSKKERAKERFMRVKNNSENDCTTKDKDRIIRKMEQQDHYVTNIIIPYDRVYVVYYISGSTGNSLEKKIDFSNFPCN